MNNGKEESVDELMICYKFPPSQRVSGVVYARRLIKSEKIVDTIQGPNFNEELDEDFNKVVDKFTNKRYQTKSYKVSPTWASIEKFNEEGMEILEKEKVYKKIYSRVGSHESHFLALEYKLKHHETFWSAEFSDPLSITIDNKKRGNPKDNIFVKNREYIDRINDEIKNYAKNYDRYFNDNGNKEDEGGIGQTALKDLDLRMIDEEFTIFQLCEYLPFLFADEIVFTNENQKELMLDFYPETKELVKSKSRVSHHPTLDEEYYHIVESDYEVDENYINFGYFGTYLGKRHLENVYYAFQYLNPQFKDKYKIHIFAQNRETLKRIISDLDFADSFIINDKAPLLEFLNLTTKFDVLIVNDLKTYGNFEKNPFLPSKLADYLGSGRDIWAIYEKGSIMSHYDLKYKSDVSDYESSLNTLKDIFKDKIDLDKEDIDIGSINGNVEDYLENRVYQLNSVIESLNSQKGVLNKKLRKEKEEVSKLKKKNNELKRKDDEISKLRKENEKLKKEMKKVKSTKGWAKYKAKNIKSRAKKKIK